MLSIGAGVIHISAAGDHTDLPVMFAGFMVVALLQIGLGALLLSRPPSRFLVAAAVAMMLSSIGLWVLSRTSGLPYLPDGHVEPVGFKDGVTKLFEIASIPALLLLLSPDLRRAWVPPRLGTHALTALGGCCLALMPPALLLGGGTQHSHDQAVALGLHDAHEGLAHAGQGSSHPHAKGERAHKAHTTNAHHASDKTAARHEHSDSVLASAPLHHDSATHAPSDGDTHDSDEHAGDRHRQGARRDHPGDKHRGGDHDDGNDHGEHEPPEAEPAISVTYEPEPSVCVGGDICLP